MGQSDRSDPAMQLAQARLKDALAAVVKAASDDRVRLAYEHGYKAGFAHGEESARDDRAIYRRGYSAGYATGKRGADEQPYGAGTGRPRQEVS